MEVKVKTYGSPEGANADAQRMSAAGWVPQGMTGGGTQLTPGRGLANTALDTVAFSALGLGPLGLFTSRKKYRKAAPVTITWTRTPEAAAEYHVRLDELMAREARAVQAAAQHKEEDRARSRERLRHGIGRRRRDGRHVCRCGDEFGFPHMKYRDIRAAHRAHVAEAVARAVDATKRPQPEPGAVA